jgi:hypothetical protein
MDWTYPTITKKIKNQTSLASSAMIGFSGAIGNDGKNTLVGVPVYSIKTEFANIMDMGFPSLNECRYKKYEKTNKISPNFSRWKLKYSPDEHPYITNFSSAFSQINTDHYSEYPQKYSNSTGIVRKQFNA